MIKNYNLGNINFLIVDDNKYMLSLIRNILNTLGVGLVVEAVDGKAAMLEMKHYPADVIICDWQMTPVNGIDFTKNIRNAKDSSKCYVPIIMLSAHTELNRIMEARDAGINEYLTKPISAYTLYSRIVSIIDNPRPFIRIGGSSPFFGPDRRRKSLVLFHGSERRKIGDDPVYKKAG